MGKIKKAQLGERLKGSYTFEKPGDRANRYNIDYSIDTTGYSAGKKKFPATKKVTGPKYESEKEVTVGKQKVKRIIENPNRVRVNKNGGSTPAWTRSEGKDPKGGLNRKGVASYRAANPGSKLKMAVTTPPSKLKKGSKAANRRKSFCARMSGVKGPMTKPNGKPTRKSLALKKWNC